jgi:diguanylate cyclase (GGDEF)-like protein
MECKFLESYHADLPEGPLHVWYCHRGDPVVLGQTAEVAGHACAACRQSESERPPGELIAEVDRRDRELMALTAIVTATNSLTDPGAVLATGLEQTMAILGVDAGWVALMCDDCLEVAVHRGLSDSYVENIERLCAGDDIAVAVGDTSEPLVLEEVYAGADTLAFARREGLETMLAAPLRVQGRLLGVLVVATRAAHVFAAEDTYFAGAAAAQLAAAVEHIRLMRGELERVDRSRRLLEAVENVNRSLGRHAAGPTILVEAAQLMGAAKSALLVVRGDALVAENVYNLSDRFRQMFVLPLDDSLSGEAIRKGETVAVEDVDEEELADPYLVAEGGYRALLTAPLQSYKGTYGAISVFFDTPRAFRDDDKTALATFAGQAAIALENERLMREKDMLARTDGLTGVANRGSLEMTLEQTMHHLHRNGGVVSLLFVDVDALKETNDRLGHQAGDAVLRDLAAVLQASCRETDTVARYGGDEFVVLMPDTDLEGALLVRSKVEAALAERNAGHADGAPVRASLGVHSAGWPEAERLLVEADRRMYETKQRHGGA